MCDDGPDEKGGQASSSGGQSGGHSAVGDSEGVLQAHQHQLGTRVETIPAQQHPRGSTQHSHSG